MNKMIISGVMAGLLTACGGGGDAPAPAPAMAFPAQPAPAPDSGTPVTAPVLSLQAVRMTNVASMNIDNTIMLLKYSDTSDKNLTLVGNSNQMWFDVGQAMATVSISGASNTIVFMAGTTVTSLTVSAGNTVYVPVGSPIKVLGTGATVKFYTQ